MIAALTPLLLSLGPAALLLVMAVVFAETGLMFGFFLPGDSLLFLVGTLAAAHVVAVPYWILIPGVFAAAVAGDQVGYLIGRRYGPRVFNRSDSKILARSHADRAERFFDRHGSRAVVIARFVPVVRTFVPVVAGVGDMDRRRFTAFNLLGAALWAGGITTAGILFGGITVVAAHIELITVGVAALSILPAAVAVTRRHHARPGASDAHGRPAVASDPNVVRETAGPDTLEPVD